MSTTRRREVAARIKEAREFGDISENAEYDDAKNEQAMLEARIAQLEDKLRSATVIDASDLDTDVVRVGSTVHVVDGDGKKLKYTIVGSAEAKPAEMKLSNESPVGKALVGHKRGEEVVVRDAQGRAQAEDHEDRSRLRRAGAAAPGWPCRAQPSAGDEPTARRARHDVFAARRQKLERAAGRRDRAVPARVDSGVEPIALGARGPRGARGRRGDIGRAPRGRPAGGAPRPGQDGVPRPGRPLGPDPAAGAGRRARRGRDGGAAGSRSRRPDRRRRDRAPLASRRADAAGHRLRRCSPSRCGRRRTSTTG